MAAGEVIKEIFMKAFESSYEMECSYLTPHPFFCSLAVPEIRSPIVYLHVSLRG
jgi:hypothetical protein